MHDNLTGLPNRQIFLDRITAMSNFAKSATNLRPTVMVIDLDRFKQVNDSVGIAVGDSILLTLARRLTRILKPQDTLARLSGDQFGLIPTSEHEVDADHGVRRNHPQDHPCADLVRWPRDLPHRLDWPRLSATHETALSDEIIKDAELAMYHSSASAATGSTSTSRRCGRGRPIA